MTPKKKVPKARKKSKDVYNDLKGCLFRCACKICGCRKIANHDCCSDELYGRLISEDAYYPIRRSPKHYEPGSLCSYAYGSCRKGNICSYPHNNVELKLWTACVEHKWSVQQFQIDLRSLVQNASYDNFMKHGISLVYACRKCPLTSTTKTTKARHLPYCTDGHRWEDKTTTLVVENGHSSVQVDRIEADTADQELLQLADIIANMIENGMSKEEIWHGYISCKQSRTTNKSKEKKIMKVPSRRVEFDFFPVPETPKEPIFDYDFDDILPSSDVDSEEEPDDEVDRNAKDYYLTMSISHIEGLERENPDKYVRCIISLRGSQKATCRPINRTNHTTENINITGRHNCGMAFDGDEVIIQIVKWLDEETSLEHTGGKVVCVTKYHTKRNAYIFACLVDEYAANLMIPICGKAPKLRVIDSHVKNHNQKNSNFNDKEVEIRYENENGQIVNHTDTSGRPRTVSLSAATRYQFIFIVKFIKWDRKNMYPLGFVTKVVRAGSDFQKAQVVLDLQYQLPTRIVSFGEEKQNYYFSLLKHLLKNDERVSLIDENVFAIDPEGSLDIDDAFSVKTYGSTFEVGVHIADVTALIEKGSDCDILASKKRTSYYRLNPEETLHMLPPFLATNICSLQLRKLRLALSCFIKFSADGKVMEKPRFDKSVVYKRHQLTYTDAEQLILNGNEEVENQLGNDLKILSRLAKALFRQRTGNELSVPISELKITNSKADDFAALNAHAIVEEFMLLVNTEVAEVLCHRADSRCILRVQQSPSKEKMANFKSQYNPVIDMIPFIRHHGKDKNISCEDDTDSSSDEATHFTVVSTFMDRLKAECEAGTLSILAVLCTEQELMPTASNAHHEWTKTQYPAEMTLRENMKNTTHYSLQKKFYTWFTSPIRRYVDIVTHRLLKAVLWESNASGSYNTGSLNEICNKFNRTIRRQKQYSQQLELMSVLDHLSAWPLYLPCPIRTISDTGLVFNVPFVKNLKDDVVTVPYSRIATCGQPLIEQGSATLRWERRIYEVGRKGVEHRREDKHSKRRLNNKWHTQTIERNIWLNILRAVAHGNFEEAAINAKQATRYFPRKRNCEVTSEMKRKEPIVNHQAKFSMVVDRDTVFQLQLSAHCSRGMLSAEIDRICLTSKFSICTEHKRDPIKCFACIAQKKSKTLYRDIQEYQETWLPILSMEAVDKAVHEGDSVTVHDVPITFYRHNKDYCGYFDLKRSFTKDRAIHFITHESEDEEDSQDYLCIRIPMVPKPTSKYLPQGNENIGPHTNWPNVHVMHALVTRTEVLSKGHNETCQTNDSSVDSSYTEEMIRVEFQLHDYKTKLTRLLTKNDTEARHMGSIEFIAKLLPDRKYYNALTTVDDANRTCIDIALGTVLNEKNLDMDKQWLDIIPKNSLRIDVRKAKDKKGKYLPLYESNKRQQDAIKASLRQKFTLIQGPPGQMHTRLAEKCPKIVRVFSENIHRQDFPIPREYTSSNKVRKYHGFDVGEMEKHALHHLIRAKGRPFAEKIKECDNLFKSTNHEKISDKEVSAYKDIIKKASISELAKYDVVFCTCTVSAGPKLKRGCNIIQCVIDECGMCTEPETLVPLISLDPQPIQVVLIGDHKQLRPIVMNNIARTLGLEKSLFERYAVMKTSGLIMLNQQYRMNEKICEFPSKQFYHGELKTTLTDYWRATGELPTKVWPNKAPFVFCHVEGTEETMSVATAEGNEKSKWNKADAAQAIRIFLAFTNVLGVYYKRITILSQYKAQVSYIEKELKEFGFRNPNVSTVVSSQGDEWDYVILSTVRSLPRYQIDKRPSTGWLKRNLGFIMNHNQINVAITRARKGLVILGNKYLLRCDNNERNGLWFKLLEHYESRGCLVDADDFPRRHDELNYRTQTMTEDNEDNAVLPPRFRKSNVFARKY